MVVKKSKYEVCFNQISIFNLFSYQETPRKHQGNQNKYFHYLKKKTLKKPLGK